MKGASEVITSLNEVITGEVTAVNWYVLHASMGMHWGYVRLYKQIDEESLEDMRHAQRLIDRILFLEGVPVLTQPLSESDAPEPLQAMYPTSRRGVPCPATPLATNHAEDPGGVEQVWWPGLECGRFSRPSGRRAHHATHARPWCPSEGNRA